MYEDTVVSFSHPDNISIADPLTGVLRAGARRPLGGGAPVGADAVIGVDLDYETIGERMLMVSANSTAVKLNPPV